MAKKILRVASFGLGIVPGIMTNAALSMKKKKPAEPQGFGDPLPIGAINPDGSQIPMDKKRRRLAPYSAATTNLTPPGTTLGG